MKIFKNFFIHAAFLLLSIGCFSVYGQNDQYTRMKNVKADIDFAHVTGTMDFRKNHSFGTTSATTTPMPQKVVEGMVTLQPALIRQFITENFFNHKDTEERDYTVLDKNLQAINSTGADIMAAICIKPKFLYPVVDQTIWKPNNIKRWQGVIEEMVKRYSVENKYVTHWGIGNEVNIGEQGGTPHLITNAKDYFEWYKMTVEPVLKVYPGAKVGGPSWASAIDEMFFDEFIGLCAKEKVRLDFVCFNTYRDNPKIHADKALQLKSVVDKYGSNIEIYVTEFNMRLFGGDRSPSIMESAMTSRRAAGLGAILHDYHKTKCVKTLHYHIFDQFNDPNEFKSFYSQPYVHSRYWNDEPFRLGLFDFDGNAYPQYFVYKMLYAMAKNEVDAKVTDPDYENVRILASRDDRYVTIFLTNYHPAADPEDITMTLNFKNAREGFAKMTVCRIDDDKRWDHLNLIPTESRNAYILDDFRFSIFVPAHSVVMVTFDYDAQTN